MRRISLDPAELETFLAIAETGSFTKAARLLALAQPSISQRVQKLEAELGTRLFDRTGRDVVLTDAGERLRMRARPIVDEMRALVSEFQDGTEARRREVRVVASPMVAAVLLPPVVRRFAEVTPGVAVHIHETVLSQALDHLAAGRADFAAMVMDSPDARFRFDLLLEDESVVVAQRGHPLLKDPVVPLDAILRYPMLLPRGHVSLVAAVTREFRKRGLDFQPILTARTVQTILGMVAAGIGIALVPTSVLRCVSPSEVGTTRIVGSPFPRRFGVVQLRGHALSPAARAFHALLRQEWPRPDAAAQAAAAE